MQHNTNRSDKRRWLGVTLLPAAVLYGSLTSSPVFGQSMPSVLKPQGTNVARQPNAAPRPMPGQGQPGRVAPPASIAPGQAPALPAEASAPEQAPVPANPGQLLLKDAAERAKTAQNDGDYSEVIAIAGEALKEKPGAAGEAYGKKLLSWAHNRRGQAFAEHGPHPQAVEDFTAALSYDPLLWRALHNRGVSQANSGNKQAAMADFNKSLELNKAYANTWYNRAELLFESGKFDLAARDFNEALRLNPQDGLSFSGRAKCFARMGKTREASQDFDAAVRLEPKNAQLRIIRADAYAAVKAYAAAAEDYKTAIAINPQAGPAYRGLAWIMATCPDQKLRNAEQAVATAQKAMELDGNSDPRYIETLAAAYANSSQFEAAAELLKHSMQEVQGDTVKRWQAQIAVYQAGKPWRDGPEQRTAAVPSQQAKNPPVKAAPKR